MKIQTTLEKVSQILYGLGEESGGQSTYKLEASGWDDLSPSLFSYFLKIKLILFWKVLFYFLGRIIQGCATGLSLHTKIDYKSIEIMTMKAKYINPFTDFGFKKLFGEEANKDLLLDFLNELFIDL